MMKRLLCMMLLIVLMLCGCSGLKESDRMSHIYYDGTDWVDIHWWDFSFEEREEQMRGDIGLTRNKVFGDSELQEAAKKAAGGLDLTQAADLLEYAARLTPAVMESGYLDKGGYSDGQKIDWKLYFIFIYNDGIATFHYDEKPASEYENGYKLEYRLSKYDGGAYMNVSLLDGHIIGFQGPYMGLISANEPSTWMKEKEFQGLAFPPADYIEFSDVTLEEHFYSTYQSLHKDDALFHAAPKSSKEKLKDHQLQKSAMELAKGINLKTPEGMAEYAMKLGELLIDSDYKMCHEQFEIFSIERYTDGAWAVDYTNRVSVGEGKNAMQWCTAYVSEDDGHIICMVDQNNGLVLGASEIKEMKSQVRMDEERSFFSDFYVEDGAVTVKCYIVLVNPAQHTVNVSLLADFTEDVQGGLLKEAEILGVLEGNPKVTVFSVPPGGAAYCIDFCGTYAGTMQKQDRLLPEIQIIKH